MKLLEDEVLTTPVPGGWLFIDLRYRTDNSTDNSAYCRIWHDLVCIYHFGRNAALKSTWFDAV